VRLDLEADSDETFVALFDPAALSAAFGEGLDMPAINAAAGAGQLIYAPDANHRRGFEGENVWALYLDAPPLAALLEHAEETLAGATLEVPSGRLWFASVEWLADLDGLTASSDGETTSVGVAAGMYRASAWTLSWPSHSSLVRAAEREGVGAATFYAARAGTVFVPLATMFALFGRPLLVGGRWLSGGSAVALQGAIWWLGAVLVLALVTAALRPSIGRAGQAWSDARRRYPDAVVHLVRIDQLLVEARSRRLGHDPGGARE
jgi:hypothetical protein